MAVDLSGGISPDREYVFPARPDDPDMRESVNAWIWDHGDVVGMPRIGVEAVGETWDSRDLQVNIAYADGRVVRLITTTSDAHSPIGPDGQATHFGGGGLAFEAPHDGGVDILGDLGDERRIAGRRGRLPQDLLQR